MKKIKLISLQRSVNKRSIITCNRWFKKLSTVFKYALLCISKIFMVPIMESNCLDKNIFESDFDLFEFDEGFLFKADVNLKKNKVKENQKDCLYNANAKKEKMDYDGKKNEKNKLDAICEYDLFIEDFNESDFFDLSKSKNKKQSPKATDYQRNEKLKKQSNRNSLLPAQASRSMNGSPLFSSTPEKQSSLDFGENQKNSHFDFLEADLFEDWNLDEMNKKSDQKETVTFSQALKLIEEAKMGMELDGGTLNQSVDLLTGDVVSSEIGEMFEESFSLPKLSDKSKKCTSNDNLVAENLKTAGKLDFASEQIKICDSAAPKKIHCFSSDDDFEYFTQDLIEKSKKVSNNQKHNSSPETPKMKRLIPMKNDLNDSTDAFLNLKKKRKKCFQVVESDTNEDSPSPKFQKRNKIRMRRNSQNNFEKDFIDLEAEVSNEFEVSSDETEEEGEYDKSFLDEESYFTQNCVANMTAKYLESINNVKFHGRFKIPEAKPLNSANIFSQIPEDNNTDYEFDSFCVKDVEEEMRTDLSDLEVAEKILEIDRKKRKKKRTRNIKK